MSFEEVTHFTLRCDGDTTRGQCPTHLVHNNDDPDDPDDPAGWTAGPDVWVLAVYELPDLDAGLRAELRAAGWLVLPDGRVMCPDHAAALDHLVRASLDGLPFPGTTAPEGGGQR